MKKIIFHLLSLAISLSVLAQKPREDSTNSAKCSNPVIEKSNKITNYRYEYDFKNFRKDQDCNIIPRHQKSKVFIRINNINRMLYQIDANGVPQSLPLEKISLFDSLANSIKAGGIDPSQGLTPDNPEKNKQIPGSRKNGLKTRENPFFKQQSEIKARLKFINDNFSAWVNEMKRLEYFSKFAKNVPMIIAGEPYSQDDLKLKLITDANVIAFDNTIITTPGFPNAAVDFPRLQASINTLPTATAQTVKAVYEKMVKAKAEIEALIAEIKTICNAKLTELIIKEKEDCDTKQFTDGFPADFDKALEQAKNIDTGKITEAAGEVSILLNKVNNPGNFYYQLNTAFDIEGDWYDAKVTLKPKSNYVNSIDPDSLVYHFPVKGKFEWAIGPALNFHFTKSMFDESFRIDSARNGTGKAKTDTFLITRNPNRNRLVPSIGIMAHFFWQRHSSITPGIVFGLSTSPVELKDLRAYLGGCLNIGGITDKIFLNAGFAFGWADRLKSNLQMGENKKSQIPFNGDTIGSPDQLVERTFQIGGFVGFTYKLSK